VGEDVPDSSDDLLKASGVKKASLEAYKEKNKLLKSHLNAALKGLRAASRNRDTAGKDKARKELAEISGRV
jgi:hypothetical protein